jgi:hypothetical protein
LQDEFNERKVFHQLASAAGGALVVTIRWTLTSVERSTLAKHWPCHRPYDPDPATQGQNDTLSDQATSLASSVGRLTVAIGVCAADSAPQTFLLTPKLLSGLEFNDHIFVHDIFNGPNVSAISKVRVRCSIICATRL